MNRYRENFEQVAFETNRCKLLDIPQLLDSVALSAHFPVQSLQNLHIVSCMDCHPETVHMDYMW